MAQPRAKAQRERDRELTSKYYLEGMNQYAIAKKLGTTQATISRDIKVLIRYWRASAAQNINSAKEIELQKINKLEVEYWIAWERSKEETKKKSLKQRGFKKDNEITQLTPVETTAQSEENNGDPRYLQGVQWCITKRCEILGINAPTKTELTGKNGEDLINITII